MLCTKSFELIKQLDSSINTLHELAPYNEDFIRLAFEECRLLFQQNQLDVQNVINNGTNTNLPAIQIRHAALQRNKRCLMTYAYVRMKWIASLRWELATVIPPKQIKLNMSDLETAWFTKYSKTLANYMRSLASSNNVQCIDLTQYTRPPKSLYVHIRCLEDYGEIELGDGHTVSLVKDSQHYVLVSDVEDLIKQGIVEHI